MNKVLLQTIATTLLNLFLLDMNYDKSIIELPFLLLLSMLAKIFKNFERSNINYYIINQMFKFQIFAILKYAKENLLIK